MGLTLETGSRVGVIGGSPAGSLFAYFLLTFAGRMDLEVDVDVYEPRDFSKPGPGDCLYVVQAGRLVVLREQRAAQVIVGELGPGEIFGEMAIFERQPRSATVRARGPARVLTLDRRAFLRGVHNDPSLAYQILRTMSGRIQRLTEELSRLEAQAGPPGPS